MLTKFVKTIFVSVKTFGETIKALREEKKLPLRKVAGYLDIDQAILCKIEGGRRNATRKQVLKLSAFFETTEHDLLVAWLSDKLVYEMQDEDIAIEALHVAEEKVTYSRRPGNNRDSMIKKINAFLKQDGRISRAWLFGSYARGDEQPASDIDLMVSYSDKASGTLLDYADISNQLELILGTKVDIVEEGYVKTVAENSIKRDKILIYG